MEPFTLVVVSDPTLRQLLDWILDEFEIAHLSFARWRQVIATVERQPMLAIVDLDDVGKDTAGVVAILRSGWGEPIPFIGLSRSPNVAEIAEQLGATEGLRKPINVGLLMSSVTRRVKPASID